MIEMKTIEAFFNNVNKVEAGCWNWNKSKDKDGYGKFWWEGGPERAHRISWLIFRGFIPEQMLVCHRCDNPSCVNPAHLFIGTASNNTQDAWSKGRVKPFPLPNRIGTKHSKKTKAKMSAAAKERWQNPAYRQKFTEANKGRKRSAEARQKMSDAARQRPASGRDGKTGRFLPASPTS